MKVVGGFLKILVLILIVVGVFIFVIANYDWVFSKRITGEVVAVERVTDPAAIFSARMTDAQMYSYSVLIKGDDGHLYTSSSEDRQWQVIKKGYCVDALLYRYPPWNLDKAGTFYNARVKDVKICPGQSALPESVPMPSHQAPLPGTPKPAEPSESVPAAK